jgi:excisionase family DNA binding protein
MEKLMDKKELAEVLGVTVKTIDKWVSERRLPFVRITGKCVRFIPSEIQAYFVKKETLPKDLGAPETKPSKRPRRNSKSNGRL